MTITGIGVDIENISRFRETPFESNELFYRKIFTDEEIFYCLIKSDPYPHFAVRFSAKEAFVKALKINNETNVIDYKSVKIIKEGFQPFIEYKNNRYLLSLSHDTDKSIAFVVIQ